MDIILPTPDMVLLAHEMVLDVSGGARGVHDENVLQAAIERPVTYVRYVDEYDVDTVCALLIDSIARNHGFRDGNKRTALLTAIFTYRMNKVTFVASSDMNIDFDDVVMWVVQQKPTIIEIETKLKIIRHKHEGKSSTFRDLITSLTEHLQQSHGSRKGKE